MGNFRWAEVSIEATPEAQEAVASIASDFAPAGIAVFSPNEAAREGGQLGLSKLELSGITKDGPTIVRFYLSDDEQILSSSLSELRARLEAEVNSGTGSQVTGISVRMVDEAEWSGWKQGFKPFRIGSGFVVTPTCEAPEAGPQDMIIRIEPGQAFGTGQHPTTASCIDMLERHIRGGERVLDVGSGTGILSIAAAMLGAGEVISVDIDPIAVRCSAENIRINRMDDRVKALKGDLLEGMEGTFDAVVANILSGPVIEMAPRVAGLLNPGGIFITAGYVLKSEPEIRRALEASGLEIKDRAQLEDWVCLMARKPVR